MKIKEKLMKLWEMLTSSRAKTLYWQLSNAGIVVTIIYLTDIDWVYAPVILPFLNMATKYINQEYLN